ncbi:AAA domain-containing protein [Streptomyces sp. NPDC051658]|uniref:AAA domain-containing protein n=1 Tax=Streptomyces sp. NPDC051658 TaxID=3365667 RepID=UPI0037ACC2A0
MDELLRAARLEIAAELRSDGGNKAKASLSEGRRLSVSGSQREYEFSFKRWPETLNGLPLLVRPSRSQGPWTPAEVTRLPDNRVRVVTEADLGHAPRQVQLRADDSQTWKVLAERLMAVGEADHPVRPTSAGWITDQGKPTVAREANPGRWVADWPSLRLNPRQRQAVEQALASEITFLWGPPGTGKTDVVAHIVEGCSRQGLNVLFLAPTKVAVDQALERICDLLSEEQGFDNGLVQRAGDIDVESLRERYGAYVDPEQVAARLSAHLQSRLTQLTSTLTTVRAGVALHERMRSLQEDLAAARKAYGAAGTARQKAGQAWSEAQGAANALGLRIKSIGTPSGLFADRKQAKLDAALIDLRKANQAAAEATAAADAAETAQNKAERDISRMGADVADQVEKLKGVAPLQTLTEEADALQQQVDEAEKELRRISDAVKANCRVLGATVSKAVQSRPLLERIDVVVIDEAGMINLPMAWYVAGLAGKRVVVAGDFRQLPAVNKAADDRGANDEDKAHARRWSATDAFRAAGLVTAAGTVRQDPRLVALSTQYRMREPICDLVNAVAYPDAPLRTGRDNESRIPFSPLVNAPVILIDTSGHCVPGPNHRTNPVHQAAVHELVRGLQYDEVLPPRKWENVLPGERATDRLAVIAPYRDQVNGLKRTLVERLGADYEGLVDTVHRFQGSQRPVVILDTVAGAGGYAGHFYQGTGLDSETCRLLNVALSRAQDHLVVIADVAFLRKTLPPHSEARTMLDHLESSAQSISVDQLIPIRSAADLAVLPDEELTRPAFFPADQVDRAVRWDIERARKRIDIYTFLLAVPRVKKWLALLAEKAAAGVSVVIHTRSPEEQREEAVVARHRGLVDQLKSAGCTVEYRERMHEKVFIVDDTVLWHGSLNLLGNLGPTDLMMRLEDPESCEQARRVMDQARRASPVYRGTGGRHPNQGSSGTKKRNPDASEGVEVGATVWGRLYLNVSYQEKDEAKRLVNARFDGDNKLWYMDAEGAIPEERQGWLRPKR